MKPPEYFRQIADAAAQLWAKLEDPILAGPWKQLFAQVQSPRHVLSELLQNADDAGAKTARVSVIDGEFQFEHNGKDFSEQEFASLCRFGYSNKRNLHTIGFRGVGFKSTFSLGNRVQIQTPTLDVHFDREQFTLPVWSADPIPSDCTRVSVRIADEYRQKQLRINFEEWLRSPVSLVFFRNLEELTIESKTIRKRPLGLGPISSSQRIELRGSKTSNLLVLRSASEAIPEDVMREIRAERNTDELHLPPCTVEVVLGLDGKQRLYVVLPSGTDIELPYSINAPFLQDPARQRIKEPEVSPCNRWLLDRAGRLAADAMVEWLEAESLSASEKQEAYALLRGPVIHASDIASSATKQVLDATVGTLRIKNRSIILTSDNHLAPIARCTAIPGPLHDVWDQNDLKNLLTNAAQHLVSPVVKRAAIEALAAHGWIQVVPDKTAVQVLANRIDIPRPKTWVRLQILWAWVWENLTHQWMVRSLRIVPVKGSACLHLCKEVSRISSRGMQIHEEDWNFVSGSLMALDDGWLNHLQKLKAKDGEDEGDPTLAVLKLLGLHEASQLEQILHQAWQRIVQQTDVPVANYVRIAKIFAALDATVPEGFRYVMENGEVRMAKEWHIVADVYGLVDAVVPSTWAERHLLHPTYSAASRSCARDQWLRWSCSAKSRMHTALPFSNKPIEFTSRQELARFVEARGGCIPMSFHYRNDRFIIDDISFAYELERYWHSQEGSKKRLWAEVARCVLMDPQMQWKAASRAVARHVSSQRSSKILDCGHILPEWLMKLRATPCLPDRQGEIRIPSELLLRTPDTESLLEVEPFVAPELDNAVAQKELLRCMGVRDKASGWETVVERLRALTKAGDPQKVLGPVLRMYEVLDRIAVRCHAGDLAKLRLLFANEALALSNNLEWVSSGELSLHADSEEGYPAVHSAANGLGLWLRLGVPERPSLERSLEWLAALEPGRRLEDASYKRAIMAITRGGRRVWDDLGHWVSLDQTWEAIASLKYRVSGRHSMRWERLAVAARRATADLRMLSADIAEAAPFTVARHLAEVITVKVTDVQRVAGRPRRMEWCQSLATGLCRVILQDEVATARVRDVAQRLLNTTWQAVNHLEVTPYIEGTPAGEPVTPRVLWSDLTLYVVDVPTVRLMRDLKDELTRPFAVAEVMAAVADCIDREPEFVREYLEGNLRLAERADLPLSRESPVGAEEGPNCVEGDLGEDLQDGHGGAESQRDIEHAGAVSKDPDIDLPTEFQQCPGIEHNPRKFKKAREVTFMDRYAGSRGFRWHEAERCYRHPSGESICRGETPFNWVEHVNSANLGRRLFVTEQSLEEGVEILSELWRIMEVEPDSILFVVRGSAGQPEEMPGRKLQVLKDAGRLQLHQSRFTLRLAKRH